MWLERREGGGKREVSGVPVTFLDLGGCYMIVSLVIIY